MRKVIISLMCILFLCGCDSQNSMDDAILAREKLQGSRGCSFTVDITADYGDKLYEFTMDCSTDKAGNITFIVREPQSIEGITGIVRGDTGELSFDGKALAFNTLADGYISPVSAPWLLIHTLCSGYIKSAGLDGELTLLSIDDSFQEDALHLDIWLDSSGVPVRGDILYKGRRCLALDVSNFSFL